MRRGLFGYTSGIMAWRPRTSSIVAATRKTRTREHVIASQSIAHVEKFIVAAGHTVERLMSDYGYDLSMATFTPDGGAEPGNVWFQLKATDALAWMRDGDTIPFSLDWKDVSLWREEPMPVILMVYDAIRENAYWLYTQALFQSDVRFRGNGSGTITVHLSRSNVLNEQAVGLFRLFKQNVLDQMRGIRHHE